MTDDKLSALHPAAKFYIARNKKTQRRWVVEMVAGFAGIKGARKSTHYLQTLRSRLGRFAEGLFNRLRVR